MQYDTLVSFLRGMPKHHNRARPSIKGLKLLMIFASNYDNINCCHGIIFGGHAEDHINATLPTTEPGSGFMGPQITNRLPRHSFLHNGDLRTVLYITNSYRSHCPDTICHTSTRLSPQKILLHAQGRMIVLNFDNAFAKCKTSLLMKLPNVIVKSISPLTR